MRPTQTTFLTLLTAAATLYPMPAEAIDIWASDCNFGFQDSPYNPGDAVMESSTTRSEPTRSTHPSPRG